MERPEQLREQIALSNETFVVIDEIQIVGRRVVLNIHIPMRRKTLETAAFFG